MSVWTIARVKLIIIIRPNVRSDKFLVTGRKTTPQLSLFSYWLCEQPSNFTLYKANLGGGRDIVYVFIFDNISCLMDIYATHVFCLSEGNYQLKWRSGSSDSISTTL